MHTTLLAWIKGSLTMTLNKLKLTGSSGEYKHHFTFISVFFQTIEYIHVSIVTNALIKNRRLEVEFWLHFLLLMWLGVVTFSFSQHEFTTCTCGFYMRCPYKMTFYIQVFSLFSYLKVNRLILSPLFWSFKNWFLV